MPNLNGESLDDGAWTPADGVAAEFLAALLGDRAAGKERSLAEYIARFPAFADRITAEYQRLQATPGPRVDAELLPPGYRLLRELGRGGQGVVFLAQDERLQRQVALKLLHPGLAAVDGPARLRFQREIEAVARLDHPCLCTIHAAGTHRQAHWIAMKFVDGPSLQQRIEQQRGIGLPQTRARFDAVAGLIEQLADGLQRAHTAGIVHRDIKPANVLLTAEGTPVLVDFGLARAPSEGASSLTMPGSVMGTPSYMAPEQLAGLRSDARSDVWSLGACLFELLAHETPFRSVSVSTEVAARAGSAQRDVRQCNAAVPRDLAAITATALAVESERRYASAAALAADLQRFRALQPVLARPASAWLVLQRWAQRNRALAMSLALLGLVVVVAFTVTLLALRDTARALADVTRLSDLKAASELQQRADTLWPLRATIVAGPAGIEAWIRDADAVLSRRELHLQAMARAVGDESAVVWQREQLQLLLAALDALQMRRARVTANREFAQQLATRTLVEPAALWQQVRAAILASPHYGGLDLAPQLGLVPLGADPASGLFEFAHLQSGVVPVRDPASGRLVTDEASAIVLVLIPGGRAVLGGEAALAADRPGNLDPQAAEGDGPCYAIELAPFFLGKHEMTQAQWRRHAFVNPANYSPEANIGELGPTLLHPVEQVAFDSVERVLRELDLRVPTEAQWEWACRGGLRDAYPYGPDERCLAGQDNLADADARAGNGSPWPFADWLHDGRQIHGPVGSYAPSRYGLFDLGGNVKEWCADTWENYPDAVPRAGDGLRVGQYAKYRVVRGGSYTSSPGFARCAHRTGLPSIVRSADVGVRAARAIER